MRQSRYKPPFPVSRNIGHGLVVATNLYGWLRVCPSSGASEPEAKHSMHMFNAEHVAHSMRTEAISFLQIAQEGWSPLLFEDIVSVGA